MTAIERLEAAKLTLDEARAAYDAALADVQSLARETGATQFKGEHITVSVCQRRNVDDTRFLAWVKEHRPDQITEAVQPSYRKVFIAGLVFDGADAITMDGEVVDFAGVTEFLSVRAR